MFRIKICGVTNVADAVLAAEAGADAVGLNFYEKSPRCVSASVAATIGSALSDRIDPVGVFVNASADAISKVCDVAFLRIVQLHGDEQPDFVKLLIRDPAITIIRAWGIDPRGMDAVYEDVLACYGAGRMPDAVLVDAAVAGMYGGTGRMIDWKRLINYEESIGKIPLILAGGLAPENVAEAIRVVRPHAVDVASGVESSPGKKDPAKVRDFVTAAREAFANLK